MIHFNAFQYHVLLQIQHVIHNPRQHDVNESETYQHEEAGEEFCRGCDRGNVAITDGAHSHDTEVKGIHKWMRLQSREVISVEVVDEHTQRQVEDKQKSSLSEKRSGIGLRGFGIGSRFVLRHNDHGRCGFASVKLVLF